MEFFDGVPLPSAVAVSYDARSNVIACTDPRSTSAPVVLTANTETTYGTTFIDLKADGPTVIECPPGSLELRG
jgi:hypothetical protein